MTWVRSRSRSLVPPRSFRLRWPLKSPFRPRFRPLLRLEDSLALSQSSLIGHKSDSRIPSSRRKTWVSLESTHTSHLIPSKGPISPESIDNPTFSSVNGGRWLWLGKTLKHTQVKNLPTGQIFLWNSNYLIWLQWYHTEKRKKLRKLILYWFTPSDMIFLTILMLKAIWANYLS